MSPTSLVDLEAVEKPLSVDDQRTAAQVDATESAAADMKEFEDGVLSQLKRVVWGEFAAAWHGDFLAALGDVSLRDLSRQGTIDDILVEEVSVSETEVLIDDITGNILVDA